jgi:hypothetical protein
MYTEKMRDIIACFSVLLTFFNRSLLIRTQRDLFVTMLLATLLLPAPVLAQKENTFDCSYQSVQGCYVAPKDNHCKEGWYPDKKVCESIKDEDECWKKFENPCITTQEKYYCNVQNGCNKCPESGCPANYPSFDNLGSCVQNCNNPASCESLGGTCKKTCGAYEDDKGKVTCDDKKPKCCVPSGPTSICKFIPHNEGVECKGSAWSEYCACKICIEDQGGSWTAIGCIQTNPADFIKTLLGFGIGIAGGIAFLLILLGGFQILTSSGNPEQLNAGKELVGAAVTGLLLIIFSLFLLRLIGFSILGIPGFG